MVVEWQKRSRERYHARDPHPTEEAPAFGMTQTLTGSLDQIRSVSEAGLRYLESAGLTGGSDSASFFAVDLITTTLIRTRSVPRIVRAPSASPPRKYPTKTATTGFTYA